MYVCTVDDSSTKDIQEIMWEMSGDRSHLALLRYHAKGKLERRDVHHINSPFILQQFST